MALYDQKKAQANKPRSPLLGQGVQQVSPLKALAEKQVAAKLQPTAPMAPQPKAGTSTAMQALSGVGAGQAPAQKAAPATSWQKAAPAPVVNTEQDLKLQALRRLREAEAAKANQAERGAAIPAEAIPSAIQAAEQGSGMGLGLGDVNKLVQEASGMTDPTQNPGPGYEWDAESGKWQKVATPAGVETDKPGWYYDPEAQEWVYDPEKAQAQALQEELKSAASGDEEFGLTQEQMAAQVGALTDQAQMAKGNISEALAARGLGTSGLVGSQFGNVDAGLMAAIVDMVMQNEALSAEERINMINALAGAQAQTGNLGVNQDALELERQKFEESVKQEDEADIFAALELILAQTGDARWGADALAWAMAQAEAGVPWSEIMAGLNVDGDDVLELTQKIKAEKNAATGGAPSPTPGVGPISGDTPAAGPVGAVQYADEWDQLPREAQGFLQELGWITGSGGMGYASEWRNLDPERKQKMIEFWNQNNWTTYPGWEEDWQQFSSPFAPEED